MIEKAVWKDFLPQVLATFLGTLMAISDGMGYGWTSPMIPFFLSNDTHVNATITMTEIEWMETSTLYGAACGLPFTVLGVNYLGRKKCMILAAFVSVICWVLLYTTNTLAFIYVSRFFVGMAGDMCFVAAPMYIAEIADPKIRGFLSATIYLMMLTGIAIVYAVGSYLPYYVGPVIGTVLSGCQVIFFPFMPESPYYLVYKNKKEEAKKSLIRLRGKGFNADSELAEIEKAVARQKTEKGRPQDLILIKSNRRAIVIMLVLNGTQHFVGISVMLMNLHAILDEAGSVYMSSSVAATSFAVVMLISASISSGLIDRFGRKNLLIVSAILTGIILLVIAIYFDLKNAGYDMASVSWVPAVCVMLYAATFKVGLGLVPIVITAEIFPTTIKALGMTIADCIYVIASIISITVYTALFENYGMQYPFYFFAACSFLAIFFVVFFIPETKGKSLEEIQLMLKGIKPQDIQVEDLKKNCGNSNGSA